MVFAKSSKTDPLGLERYRVPMLDKSLDVLEAMVGYSDGLTLTELTEALKMPKNSVFRIASTLTIRGYVERDEASKRYRVSRKLLSLGHNAIGGRRLLELAGPVLKALMDETRETALLGTLSGRRGVVLDQVASSHPVKVVVEIGHPFPLHTAAPAKAILAFLNPAQQQRLTDGLEFKSFTKTTIKSQRAYRKELANVLKEGVAYDRKEESLMYACVAAPVFDHKAYPVAAIWISGPADRVTPEQMPGLAKIVRRHAARLSAALGYEKNSA